MKKLKLWNTLPSDAAKKILKSKKFDANKKMEKIVDLYCDYYQKDLGNHVKNCTLENYYESIFDKNGVANQTMFKKLYNNEFCNEVHVNIIHLNEYVNRLGETGLEVENLNEKSFLFLTTLSHANAKINIVNDYSKLTDNIFKDFYKDIEYIGKKYNIANDEKTL